MFERSVFIPGGLVETKEARPVLVERVDVAFEGYMPSYPQGIKQVIKQLQLTLEDVGQILEVSTKGDQAIGRSLSAFNLPIAPWLKPEQVDRNIPLESLFQSSKCFEQGRQYPDLLRAKPWEAKTDRRLRTSGKLTGFSLRHLNQEVIREEELNWELEPKTAFYDWIYCQSLHALVLNQGIKIEELEQTAGFSDVMWDVRRSINCQARSVALYLALRRNNLLHTLNSKKDFLKLYEEYVID